MDNKLNFVKNDVLRLPPGFRFHPTDEELVVKYLRPKVLCYPLPASIIPEVEVCKSDPWDLPGGSEQERYFFSTKEVKYPNGNRSNRATSSGYWKATGLDKQIVSSRSGHQVVGMKKTLVFYGGKPPMGRRTDWIMHEYRLTNAHNSDQMAKVAPQENRVLCRIFLKRRNNKNDGDVTTQQNVAAAATAASGPVFFDFMARGRADLNLLPDSSSSGSSGITEMSKNQESDDHEESSSCNILSKKKPCP